MRGPLFALIFLLLAGCASTRPPALSSVEIKEIKLRYIETEEFKRVSEYLTGKEDLGDRVVLRSQPEFRDGYYFILILDENVRRLPRSARIIGEFYTPFSVEKQSHTFDLPKNLVSSKEIFVGLTGEDWPEEGESPSAWRFTIEDASGTQLAQKQSFLWEL